MDGQVFGRFDLPPWVSAKLPGYTKDGRFALLRFTFGPFPHGAGGYYLLRKVNGRWEIIDRALYYYS